jgi:hypothetical protein
LAGNFNFAGQRPDFVRLNNSHFGLRVMNRNELITDFSCPDFMANDCEFNSHAGNVIDYESTHAAGDWTRFYNCRFLSNSASNRYVRSAGTPRTNIGKIIFAGCTLNNAGAGPMYVSSSEFDELAYATDYNGDLLFDDTLIGTGGGAHPDPGAGPSYFSGLPVPSTNGRKIWNINWSPDLTQVISEKGWIAHNGVWKELT